MSEKIINTIVLTTHENFQWMSMQEIIPGIERTWILSQKKDHVVTLINVDHEPLKKYWLKILRAQNIVLVAFNLRVAQMAYQIRKKMGVDARFIIYVHGMASIGFWPFYKWKLGDIFNSNDIFISSSKKDRELVKLSFNENPIEVFPFCFPHRPMLKNMPINNRNKKNRFIYVGRVSEQKNLHTLIYSFFIFKNTYKCDDFYLEIIGNEDKLGSPNMGMFYDGYLNFLNNLVEKLNLQHQVHFLGFIPREELEAKLLEIDYTFISLSLHSDENFGMAALSSLFKNKKCIITDWGGHTDFKEYFPHLVKLIPVSISQKGPHINPMTVAKSLFELQRKFSDNIDKNDSESFLFYDENEIAKKVYDLAISSLSKNQEIKKSSFTEKVLQRQKKFNGESKKIDHKDSRKGCQIFNGYNDQLAIQCFQVYAHNDLLLEKNTKKNDYYTYPWVVLEENKIKINDPHRGVENFTIESQEKKSLKAVWFHEGPKVFLDKISFQKLYQGGHLYTIDS